MPNTNQILFVAIIAVLFTVTLLGAFMLMNKINNRRRELFDLEQRLQVQEQQLQFQIQHSQQLDSYQPAIIKQGHQIIHPMIMTPTKKVTSNKRESFLNKVYGFRTASAPPPPFLPTELLRPSAVRPPSFLPMKEKPKSQDPPAYDDYHTSSLIEKGSDDMEKNNTV